MILLIRQELSKLYRRLSPYIIYAIIALLVVLIATGMKYGNHFDRALDRAQSRVTDFEFVGRPLNGMMVCQMVLLSVATLLPFLAPVVAGEILGAEGADGTLRTILVRPRRRGAIWLAKYLTAGIYALSTCGFMYLFSLGLGVWMLGSGQLWEWNALQDGRLVVLSAREAMAFLALAYLVLGIVVFAASSLAFMVASFFDNALLPGFIALGLMFTMQVTGSLDFEWIDAVRPYLLTNYLGDYRHAFPTEFDQQTYQLIVPWDAVTPSLRVAFGYLAVCGAVGWWRFVRRDVTC